MSKNIQKSYITFGLQDIEINWQIELPAAFQTLYSHLSHPFIAPCEFFSIEGILEGQGRAFGRLPQFLPFGSVTGEASLYGFYSLPDMLANSMPVLYLDEEEGFLRPVASSFDAFLRYCLVVGRYETSEFKVEDQAEREEDTEFLEYARMLNIDESLLKKTVPRNDTELYQHLINSDPQDVVSLSHLACSARSQGDYERALDFMHRANESAGWFGDTSYLLADIYRERGQYSRAVTGWWKTVHSVLPLSTRTWEWDLGEDHPEADIYEVAADALEQFQGAAPPEMMESPLWEVVVEEDPYDPAIREALGKKLLSKNDFAGAEREFLNALSLSALDSGKQSKRLYGKIIDIYEQTGRTRDAALAREDMKRPAE